MASGRGGDDDTHWQHQRTHKHHTSPPKGSSPISAELLSTSSGRSIGPTFRTTSTSAVAVDQVLDEDTVITSETESTGPDDDSAMMHAALESVNQMLATGDECILTVALENSRFMVVVSHCDGQAAIMGLERNIRGRFQLSVVAPVLRSGKLTMDGDGGFHYAPAVRGRRVFQMKPSSVRSLWTAVQSLLKVLESAEEDLKNDETWPWLAQYIAQIPDPEAALKRWSWERDTTPHLSELESIRQAAQDNENPTVAKSHGDSELERQMTKKLKELLFNSDLDSVTSKQLRVALEQAFGKSLKEYKSFIDQQMITIMGQMDRASRIFDYMYLGTEWNASNLEELESNNCRYVLNVTKEITNYFPDKIKYMNIRLWDVPSANLMPHWEDTFRFIREAKRNGSGVLIHCKMGVSRSASTVIAYAMKQYNWSLAQAHAFVRKRRARIKPNEGFKQQLIVYEGILRAKRESEAWNKRIRNMSIETIPVTREPNDTSIGVVSPPPSPPASPPGSPPPRRPLSYHEDDVSYGSYSSMSGGSRSSSGSPTSDEGGDSDERSGHRRWRRPAPVRSKDGAPGVGSGPANLQGPNSSGRSNARSGGSTDNSRHTEFPMASVVPPTPVTPTPSSTPSTTPLGDEEHPLPLPVREAPRQRTSSAPDVSTKEKMARARNIPPPKRGPSAAARRTISMPAGSAEAEAEGPGAPELGCPAVSVSSSSPSSPLPSRAGGRGEGVSVRIVSPTSPDTYSPTKMGPDGTTSSPSSLSRQSKSSGAGFISGGGTSLPLPVRSGGAARSRSLPASPTIHLESAAASDYEDDGHDGDTEDEHDRAARESQRQETESTMLRRHMALLEVRVADLTAIVQSLRTGRAGGVPHSAVAGWSSSDVAVWLDQRGLGSFVAVFKQNGVNGTDLMDLSNSDLLSIGILQLTARKRILRAVSELVGRPPT